MHLRIWVDFDSSTIALCMKGKVAKGCLVCPSVILSNLPGSICLERNQLDHVNLFVTLEKQTFAKVGCLPFVEDAVHSGLFMN
jgi:hypothetical protein